jgi:hypothetical protein
MGQGDQTIGQQLDRPALAPFWRLALGQGRQDGFNFFVDLRQTPGPRALVQRSIKTAQHEIASRPLDRRDAGLEGRRYVRIGLVGMGQQ